MIEHFRRLLTVFIQMFLYVSITGAIGVMLYYTVELPKISWFNTVIMSLFAIWVAVLALYLVYLAIKKNADWRFTLTGIVIFSTIVKLLWVYLVPTIPVSDFATIFDSGKSLFNGDYSQFRGNGYIARFPHLAYTTVIFGYIQHFLTHPLLTLKIINVILSAIDLLLIFHISRALFDEQKALYTALTLALFLPFTAYVSVGCSENFAMPFFMLSFYLLIKAIKSNKTYLYILCGAMLSVGNLFRMVGIVFLIAIVLYLITIKNKGIFALIIAYFAVYFIADAVLINSGVMEYHLWRGNEPTVTSILKGTNFDSGGAWNYDDTVLHEKNGFDYQKTSQQAWSIIIQRLSNPYFFQTIGLYAFKLFSQWSMGDFMGIFWSQNGNLLSGCASGFLIYSQLFYAVLLFGILFGIKKNKHQEEFIPLFLLVILGFIAMYLLIETQPRYGYIIAWIFPLLNYQHNRRTL